MLVNPVCCIGSQILIHITTDIFPCNAAQKEYFVMSYPASAGICYDVLTCCIHGSQQGHLAVCLSIENMIERLWQLVQPFCIYRLME